MGWCAAARGGCLALEKALDLKSAGGLPSQPCTVPAHGIAPRRAATADCHWETMAVAYRLLIIRTQGQNTDVEVKLDEAIGDIGALEIAHPIEELAHSQSAVNMVATKGPTAALSVGRVNGSVPSAPDNASIALANDVPYSQNDVDVHEEYKQVKEDEKNAHADGPDETKPSIVHRQARSPRRGLHGAPQRWVAQGTTLPHLEIPVGARATRDT